MSGWICLHRKFQENPLWREKRSFSKAEAWIDILMEARHSDEPHSVLIGSKLITCERGQCIKSLDTWASRWGWSKSKVRRFLTLLQSLNQIRHEGVTKTTRLTVCNYDTYNDQRNARDTQVKRTRHASETHAALNNNDNKENNDNISQKKTYKQWSEKDFSEECKIVHKQHAILDDGEEVNRFFLHWSEKDTRGNMRLQKQQTWDTMRRMVTWRANGERLGKGKRVSSKPEQSMWALRQALDMTIQEAESDPYAIPDVKKERTARIKKLRHKIAAFGTE